MMWVFAALLAMAAAPADDIAEMGRMPDAVRDAAVGAIALPLPERIDAVSRSMLNVPYVNDPLGEGTGPDPDPLVRYDAFDCLTYVEEVLALSLSPDPTHAADVRLSLRYGEHPAEYRYRHHFMEMQWIPAAIDNGWLRETTAEYGPVQTYERTIDGATWDAWRSRSSFQLQDDELPSGVMRLDYLSLDDALAAVDRIRPGSIIMTVREDRSWSPIWISHVSLVVPGEHATLRHASRSRSVMETRDQGFAWYLGTLKAYKNWKAVGIAIYEPIDVGPRRSEVTQP